MHIAHGSYLINGSIILFHLPALEMQDIFSESELINEWMSTGINGYICLSSKTKQNI
jgi:hypothetical protein